MTTTTGSTEALQYFTERLHSRRTRPRWRLSLRKPRRVTRRVALRLAPGAPETIPGVDRSVVVRCARGSLWLTQDGDCKDVVLGAWQEYRVDRESDLRMHALRPCVVEIEFEDELEPGEV